MSQPMGDFCIWDAMEEADSNCGLAESSASGLWSVQRYSVVRLWFVFSGGFMFFRRHSLWFTLSFIADSGTIFYKEDFHYEIFQPEAPTGIFSACSSWAWPRLLFLSKPQQRRWDTKTLNLSDIAELQSVFQASCQWLDEASTLFPIVIVVVAFFFPAVWFLPSKAAITYW